MSWLITGAQKVNWDPSLVSTALWLDASDSSTITLTDSKVSEWRDKSGNNRHAFNTTVSERPTISSGSLSFNVVRFSTSTLTVGNPFGQSSLSVQAYILWNKPISGGQQYQRIISTGPAFGTDFTSNGIYYIPNTPDNSIGSGGPGITELAGSPGTKNLSVVTLGRVNVTSSAENNSFDIGEIVITTNSDLAIGEKIQGYLAHKWGLTAILPADHPYKTAAPVP